MDGAFVTLARVVKPQGRHGEVAAEIHTDFPELFAGRRCLFALFPDGSRRELRLEDHWLHKGRVVLKFAAVDSIGEAEKLAGCEIQIPASQRAPLEPGASYISDLVGCAVYVLPWPAEEGQGRHIGEIDEVQFGAGEAPLLVVRRQAKEYMIPFAEEYLKSLDLEGRRMLLSLPEGMLELDAPLSEEEKRAQRKSPA